MKRFCVLISLALLTAISLAGCTTTGTLHTPTTAGNAGTSALVAYSLAGFTAGQYLALPLCGTPAVYPCKTRAINDKLLAADAMAYNAAKAADAAGDPAAATAAIAALNADTADPAVKAQIDLVKARTGGAP